MSLHLQLSIIAFHLSSEWIRKIICFVLNVDIKNKFFCGFQIGGVETVTLGDEEARARRCQKSILERKSPATFYFLIEMRERHYWVTHKVCISTSFLLVVMKVDSIS